MKFLIDNYATHNNTQPFYFNEIINLIDGCKSDIWSDKRISFYDTMDKFQPDIFLTHAQLLTRETFEYCKENKNISLILNISDTSSKVLENIINLISENNINCNLFISNDFNVVNKFAINTISIPPALDTFLNTTKEKSYQIDKCFITDSIDHINTKEEKCSYHIVSTSQELLGSVDIVLPTMNLGNLYKNYSEIIFSEPSSVTQTLFDATYYGNKISINTKNTELLENIYSIFKTRSLNDSDKLKQSIKQKHTGFHRVKSLLSQLSCSNHIAKLEKIMEGIQWE